MSNNPVLIHIGFHKTGTTWLQRYLFQPRNGFHKLLSHAEVDQHIIKPHELTYDPNNFLSFLNDKLAENTTKNVNVISSEIISGNPFYGGRESCEYAQRLHAALPNAKILITIRNQIKILVSVYMQYLSRGGARSPEEFFNDQLDFGYFGFSAEHFYYHRLASYYQRLFGIENVLVTTQESLARDAQEFGGRIGLFSGNCILEGNVLKNLKPFGVSYPEFMTFALRRINYFRVGPAGKTTIVKLGPISETLYNGAGHFGNLNFVRETFGSWKPVTTYVEKKFRGSFRKSNKLLQNMINEDLVELGYEY